jgi:hypothetical protein
LTQCIDVNKPIVILEGSNVWWIRKNEKGEIEIIKFIIESKTLKINSDIQINSEDYVNAFQLFGRKHKFDGNNSETSLGNMQNDL